MPAEKGPFLVCRKRGKIVGLNRRWRWFKWVLPLASVPALAWFLIRVIPKPSRASYPCQRVAAPIALGGLTYFLSLFGVVSAFRHSQKFLRQKRHVVAAVCLAIAFVSAVVVVRQNESPAQAAIENTGTFVTPADGLTNPIGTARGIYPGRVAWSYDTNACNWDGTTKYWWSSQFNDQAKITALMNNVICSVTGQSSVSNAWDVLFRCKNGGPTAPSYVRGQSIAIKINENNGGNGTMIDASPQSVYALLDGLVNQFGASQTDITLCDPARTGKSAAVQAYCLTAFPNVNYNNNVGTFTANAFAYSVSGPTETSLATTIVNTKYLITMALLKRHSRPYATWGDGTFDDGNSPVTMIFKSDWGIIGANRSSQHELLHTWMNPIASYDLLVDIYGSTNISGKTVLTILDGLYSGSLWNSGPYKWNMAPFNGHWPSSFFASQDPVALESVGLDFIWAEMGLVANADRHLREAALANNPPSGTVYKPDGVRLQSLGVHEHWNDSTNKLFSRNLGTGLGIELVTIAPGVPCVSIAGLASGMTVSPGTNLPIQSLVLNNTNPVSQVDFYQGTQLLGTSTATPGSIIWNNVPAGNYVLKAVATDSSGLSVTSNPVNISVSTPPAPITWDANTGVTGAQDGGGVWDLATPNWWNGTANVTWNSAVAPPMTTFGTANAVAGTVTLGAAITISNLTFNAAGSGDYTIAGGGNALTIANTPVVSVAANCSPTISASVAGGGFSKTGAGTLTLSGANTASGTFSISGGTLALAGDNSGSTAAASVASGTVLQLANADGLKGALTLNSGSTLQLRADANTTFAPASVALDNASDVNNFDVRPAGSAIGKTLTLSGALAYSSSSDQTINVTGSGGYTLGLGAISVTATSHNPYRMMNVNVVPGLGAVIASFKAGNYGNYFNLTGGGKVTVTGNLANTSNGSVDLFVNGGTTATLQGQSVKSGAGDAYRYYVPNGTLVVDNNSALINNTTGAGLNSSQFVLGAATNIYAGVSGVSAPAAALVKANNSYNCAVYLGDTDYPNGGLTLAANVTNYVSDGDAGFANSGTMTIGGQNTSGINTYANPIILGWTANKGKSVTLAAATGGDVDFTGTILQNGTDSTAGVKVGDATHGGIVKLTGANTYAGGTTVANGTLLVNNTTGSGTGSGPVTVNSGGALGGAGIINGAVTVNSGGAITPGTGTAVGTLTINNNLTLAGNFFVKINKSLSPSNDVVTVSGILTNAGAGVLTLTNFGPAFAAGDSFQLFNKSLSNGGALTFNPAAPGMGLRWVNNLSVDGTVGVAMVATNSVWLAPSFNGSNFSIFWPADHTGWRLQAQTNPPGSGLGSNWTDVCGAASTNQCIMPLGAADGSVFYRLIYP